MDHAGAICNVLGSCVLSALGLALQSKVLRAENPGQDDNARHTNCVWGLGFVLSLLAFGITSDALRTLSPATVAVLSPATLLFLFLIQHLGIVRSPDQPPQQPVLVWCAAATLASVVVAVASSTWTQEPITAQRACALPMVVWASGLLQLLIVLMFDAPSLESLSLLLACASSSVTISLGNAIGMGELSWIPVFVVVAGTAACVVLFQAIMCMYPLQISISLYFPLTQAVTFFSGVVLCVQWESVSIPSGVIAGLFSAVSVGSSWHVIRLNHSLKSAAEDQPSDSNAAAAAGS